jgi:SAM-dependent methyltransferase
LSNAQSLKTEAIMHADFLWDADTLMRFMAGYQPAMVLATAMDLELFDLLAEESGTAEELAQRTGFEPRATRILLDALSGQGLLEKSTGRYTVPASLIPLLASGEPGSMRAMARHHACMIRRWSTLPRVVRGDEPPPIPGSSVRGEAADHESFIDAMDNISRRTAPGLLGALEIPPFDCLLDVGGASGTWTIEWLRKQPGARAILFDLPAVIPMARRRLAAEAMLDRIRLVAGDYSHDALPEGGDLAWVSAIVHQQGREENRALFRRVFDALVPGGRILVRDIVLEPDRTAPPYGALFAVNMLVSTGSGDCFTFEELQDDLYSAGFAEIARIHADEGMNTVLSARKVR